MTTNEAERVIMPFGGYKGRTLGDIADEDILYLDWLNDPDREIRSERLLLAVAAICAARSAQIDAALDAQGDD